MKPDSPTSASPWQTFDMKALTAALSDAPVEYKEFLNVPALSCGIYRLSAGAKDMQSPHDDDEVYFVLEGKAKFRVGDEDKTIGPGELLYISATEEHSFFEIEEDMVLLVFFARLS